MPRYREAINSFLRGEVSPRMWGRTELDEYKQGCEKVQNAIIYPQGGAARRPGSTFKWKLEDEFTDELSNDISHSVGTFSLANCRHFPFVISETQKYVVVVGAGQGYSENFPGGDTQSTVRRYPIVIYDANTGARYTPFARFNLTIDPLDVITGMDLPRWFNDADRLKNIQFEQKGNVLFLTEERTMPFAIEFVNDFASALYPNMNSPFAVRSLWAFGALGTFPALGLGNDGYLSFPYETLNTSSGDTLTLSADGAVGDLMTITDNTTNGTIIDTSMLGMPIRIDASNGSDTGFYLIVSDAGGGVWNAKILKTGAGTVATSSWSRTMWSSSNPMSVTGSAAPAYSSSQDTLARFWPRAISTFQNRLIYGGNKGFQTWIWGSKQGDFSNFKTFQYAGVAQTITAEMAFSFEISSSGKVPANVKWLSAGKTLACGTLAREYIISGPDNTQSLGPLNVDFSPETNHGSALVQPERSENALMFVQRSGRKIREFVFNFAEDSFRSEDLTYFSEHIVDNGVRASDSLIKTRDAQFIMMCHQESENGITWFLDDYGALTGMTRNRQLNVMAPHSHQIGGEDVVVKSIFTMISDYALHDDLWMIVQRTVDGEQVGYIEVIQRECITEEWPADPTTIGDVDLNDIIYCDSALVYKNATAFSTVAVAHLPSTEVEVIADYKYLGRKTVAADGNLALGAEYKHVVVGLPYRTVVKTLNLEAGSAIGSSQGAMKRIDEVNLRFDRTMAAKFGPNEDNLQDLVFRPAQLIPNDPIPLSSLDMTNKFQLGHSRKVHVCIVQDLPLPMSITSIVARLVERD